MLVSVEQIMRTIEFEDLEVSRQRLEVSGTGEIRVVSTGGTSASEGGMGTGGDDKAKGDLTNPDGNKSGNRDSDKTDEDTSFDPIKKSVKEAERANDKD